MISVYLECAAGQQDQLIAELNDRGTAGVLQLSTGLRAWFDNAAGIADLIEQYDGAVLPDDEEDWERRTRESFPAFAIGERFWLAPPWNSDPEPPGRMRLEINPGLACGTGWHPCTQMCLEALERYLAPGASVLDVGTGSGILMAAAELLGAGRVAGCDIDVDAVAVARERTGNRVFAGSAAAVRDGAFDVVVANISAPAVTVLLPDFRRVCRVSGTLILSGFASIPAPAGTLETLEREGWQCLVVRS